MAPDTGFDRWVVRPRRRPGARLRLFCLPYAGGGASVFHEWPSRLPETIEVCSIQLPGRENRLRDEPYRDSVSLVRDLLRVLSPLFDMPVAVFGHSMGALLGFELARQLAAAGEIAPWRVFAGASRPPHAASKRPPLRAAGDAEILAEVFRMGGTPTAVLQSRELMALALPTLRADFAVHETYRSDAQLTIPITAFCGTADPEVSAEEMSEWRASTLGDFRLQLIDGDHFFLRTAAGSLLASLAADLETSLSPSNPLIR